jgi:hypothetical protein
MGLGKGYRSTCGCVFGGGGSILGTKIADTRFKKALMLSEIFVSTLQNLQQLDGRRKSHSVGPT